MNRSVFKALAIVETPQVHNFLANRTVYSKGRESVRLPISTFSEL